MKAAIIRSASLLNTGGIDTADFALGESWGRHDGESEARRKGLPLRRRKSSDSPLTLPMARPIVPGDAPEALAGLHRHHSNDVPGSL